MSAISLLVIGSFTNANVPWSRISRAARMNAANATREGDLVVFTFQRKDTGDVALVCR